MTSANIPYSKQTNTNDKLSNPSQQWKTPVNTNKYNKYLFFGSGWVNGFSMTPPILDIPKDDLVIPVYQTLQITCRYVLIVTTFF